MLTPQTVDLIAPERWAAFRLLLYRAFVDIRNMGHSPWGRNPFECRRYLHSRLAGSLANLLHNAAYYSAHDFKGFDERRFWRNYDRFEARWRRLDPVGWEMLWCREAIDACRPPAGPDRPTRDAAGSN